MKLGLDMQHRLLSLSQIPIISGERRKGGEADVVDMKMSKDIQHRPSPLETTEQSESWEQSSKRMRLG